MAMFLNSAHVLQIQQESLRNFLLQTMREKIQPNSPYSEEELRQAQFWGIDLLLKRFCSGLHFNHVQNEVNYDMFNYVIVAAIPFNVEVYEVINSVGVPFSFANMQSKIYEKQLIAVGTKDLNSSNLVALTCALTQKILLTADLTEEIQKMRELFEEFK